MEGASASCQAFYTTLIVFHEIFSFAITQDEAQTSLLMRFFSPILHSQILIYQQFFCAIKIWKHCFFKRFVEFCCRKKSKKNAQNINWEMQCGILFPKPWSPLFIPPIEYGSLLKKTSGQSVRLLPSDDHFVVALWYSDPQRHRIAALLPGIFSPGDRPRQVSGRCVLTLAWICPWQCSWSIGLCFSDRGMLKMARNCWELLICEHLITKLLDKVWLQFNQFIAGISFTDRIFFRKKWGIFQNTNSPSYDWSQPHMRSTVFQRNSLGFLQVAYSPRAIIVSFKFFLSKYHLCTLCCAMFVF